MAAGEVEPTAFLSLKRGVGDLVLNVAHKLRDAEVFTSRAARRLDRLPEGDARGVYVLETVSSLLQWYSIRFMSHKIFQIAPIHHHFEALGWPETKVVMRFWLVGAFLSLVGLLIYNLLRFG